MTDQPSRTSPRSAASVSRLAAVVAALVVMGALTMQSSRAAFSDTTVNTANAFSTGSVVLTDDDTDTAMFNATDMSPTTPIVECITVTYSGSIVPAPIKLYGTATGTLAPYLDVTIEEGTGGQFGDCTGFTAASTLFTDTLDSFAASHTAWGDGLAVHTALANPTDRTLRFTVQVQDDNAAQGLTASADFTFEAQGS